jgi:DNA-binding CsgD family transcriptional regulator
LYRRVLGPLGAADQIVIGLPAPWPVTIGVPLNRDTWGFTARDRAVLNELRPHLAQAHTTAAGLDAAQRSVASRDAALHEAGCGVLRLHGRHVVDASPLARRWLTPALVQRGQLTGQLRDWYDRERTRLDGNALPAVGLLFPTVSTTDGRAATIRFLDPTVLLVEETVAPARSEDLQRLGLTPAQANVLHRIVLGTSTAGTAAALHVTPGTVRKHLQDAYRKLGVHSRTEATSLAHSTRSSLYPTRGQPPALTPPAAQVPRSSQPS